MGGAGPQPVDPTEYTCAKIIETRQWYKMIDESQVLCIHTEEYVPKDKEAA